MSLISFSRCTALATGIALLALSGCSSVGSMLEGDRIDYRSGGRRTQPLEVPPDLTQLAREGRFNPQNTGSISASGYGQATQAAAAVSVPTVAASSVGDLRIERAGSQRWLVTSMTPEKLWPQLQSFWQDLGFTLVVNAPETGVIETEWAENRAKLPQDIIRNTVGRVFDSLYSTGERDKYRTRVERTPAGTEIYISHRGLEEVYADDKKDTTIWQPRPVDAQLEAEFLSRLMVKLGAKEEVARTAVETAPAAPARARLVGGSGAAAMQVDEGFDRAWRRVGLALDRTGFTVEDRDRNGGLYYVRYIDPQAAPKQAPGLLDRLFGSKDSTNAPVRLRIALKGEGEGKTNVSIQNAQGAPESGPTGQRIVALLVDDLK